MSHTHCIIIKVFTPSEFCHYKLLVRFFVSLITKTNIWQTDRKIFNEINQVSGNILPGTIDKVDKLWF